MPEKKTYTLLVINPGSTSTKISVYDDEVSRFERSVQHEAQELLQYPHVNDQVPMRCRVIEEMLAGEGMKLSDIDVFIGRGGSAHTQPGGVTVIDERLYNDTVAGVGGSEHAAKLGVMIAWVFMNEYHKPGYTLNPTAVAEHHAGVLGRTYEDCDFVVAHIDGGVTVTAHKHGRIIDGTMGSDGDGPFAPTRIGAIPVLPLLDYIEAHSLDEVRLACSRSGGFVSFFGTSNSDKVHALVDRGDPKAMLVWNAMIYQICKCIGACSCVLEGKVDAILLTGGLMRFDDITEGIRRRCGWIAPIAVYPGEMEQDAMALPVMKVLRGEATAMTYSGRDVWQGFVGMDL